MDLCLQLITLTRIIMLSAYLSMEMIVMTIMQNGCQNGNYNDGQKLLYTLK